MQFAPILCINLIKVSKITRLQSRYGLLCLIQMTQSKLNTPGLTLWYLFSHEMLSSFNHMWLIQAKPKWASKLSIIGNAVNSYLHVYIRSSIFVVFTRTIKKNTCNFFLQNRFVCKCVIILVFPLKKKLE